LFAFSTENWHRPTDEVDALMLLFIDYLDKELPLM
jgi:undecaprenyl diphosphate synthase